MSWQHASLRSVQQKLNVASLWDSLFVYQPRQESPESRVDRLWVFDAADEVEISIHVSDDCVGLLVNYGY